MITIDQLLESLDLDFEPRWVTKDNNGEIWIWNYKPVKDCNWHIQRNVPREFCGFFITNKIKLSEFDGKDWTECIYEVPQKTTGKIEKLDVHAGNMQLSSASMTRNQFVANTIMKKINELVEYVNALIESNNIHEKQIDELQMKLEPEKCAVNELKGAKNE